MVLLLGGTGGVAYIVLTILLLSEVGQNRHKGAKSSWKKCLGELLNKEFLEKLGI